MKTLFSLIEPPISFHFPDLYQALDIVAERFDSARNLHRALQKQPPDFFVGEFTGQGSGLDILFYSQDAPRRHAYRLD